MPCNVFVIGVPSAPAMIRLEASSAVKTEDVLPPSSVLVNFDVSNWIGRCDRFWILNQRTTIRVRVLGKNQALSFAGKPNVSLYSNDFSATTAKWSSVRIMGASVLSRTGYKVS